MRRLRVPTPPTLSDDDRQRVALMLDAAPDTTFRVLAVLVEIDGFTVADASAIMDMPPLSAQEQLRSMRLLAAEKFLFDRRALASRQHDGRDAEASPPRAKCRTTVNRRKRRGGVS